MVGYRTDRLETFVAWVADFETQMDSPVDQLKVKDLARRYGPLAFRRFERQRGSIP